MSSSTETSGPPVGGGRTLWEEGHRPGAQVIAAVTAVLAVVVVLDVALLSGPGLLFGLVFVAVCVAAALLVRPRDFFAVGVLPPLLMLGVFVVLAVARRDAVARPGDGVVQAVVSGLSHHSLALGLGYALCLAVLALRDRILKGVVRPGGLERHAPGGLLRSGPGRPPRPAAPPARPATSPRPSWARRGSPPPR